MKTLIFITLKILEVLAFAIFCFMIIVIMAVIDIFTGGIMSTFGNWLRGIENIERINLIVLLITTPLGAIYWLPLWIKSNKKLTSKIYKRLKK